MEYAWKSDVDYRQHPELYKIGRGQQGVLICEPYKSEILPHWRFRTPEIALKSAKTIYAKFLGYLDDNDFVGADMAKKYLHMGFTRARRYANHHSGRKYAKDGSVLPQEEDSMSCEKAESARIFKVYWDKARKNSDYLYMKGKWNEERLP